MENFDAFIDSLADHEPVVKTSSTRKTFPCGQCAGTGKSQQT